MTIDLLFAFITYVFATSITPGPNNTMLIVSGVNFGFKRTVPHLFGITTGLSSMLFAMGSGIGALFATVPVLQSSMRLLSTLYLIFLAWKIASSGAPSDAEAVARPMTFFQAAAFQWVNPKAWIMTIGAVTAYLPAQHTVSAIFPLVAISFLVGLPCICTWTVAGSKLRKFLNQQRYLRIFNITMALVLLASLYPIFLDTVG